MPPNKKKRHKQKKEEGGDWIKRHSNEKTTFHQVLVICQKQESDFMCLR
jgi:hypothetical protein